MRWARLLALLAVFGLIAAACGDSDDDSSDETEAPAETTEAPTDETEAPAETTEAPTDETEAPADGEAAAAGLSSCPNPLIIQTDWFPEPEHGATYQLVDVSQGSWNGSDAFVGPLAADPSIEVQIRPGGPFIGFQAVTAQLYQNPDILLGYAGLDDSIANFAEFPTTAVVAPLDINPQIIMWDPETYPDVASFSDIGATGATVVHFTPAYYMEYLISTGQIDAGQSDGSYDGSSVRFIAEEGAIFQQGFATQEPWNYENQFDEWGKPVDFLLIHDSGYENYAAPLSLRTELLDDPAVNECLAALVPIVQQAIIDFQADPQPVKDAIEQMLIEINDFWQLSQESMTNTVTQMEELDIVGNGPNGTVGDFDLERVEELIALIDTEVTSLEVPEGLTPDDVVTNEFIDPSIGF